MSVVKHSYVSAKGLRGGTMVARRTAAVGKVLAHVKYVEHRPGEDKEKESRDLFDRENDKASGKKFRQAVKGLRDANVVAHKLVLAPEIAPADHRAYTREIMGQLSKDKGLDLTWIGAGHNNTDHAHVHVVLLGVDANGKDVRLTKDDHSKLREYSERYLKREHALEYDVYKREKERAREQSKPKERENQPLDRTNMTDPKVELPWMHRKIVREQLEPFKEWQKNKELEKSEPQPRGDQTRTGESIEAVGKTWTKENTQAELKELNQFLWDNFDARIPVQDYRTLVGWIKDKERGLGKDKIQALGKDWTKKNSLDELKELNKDLWAQPEVTIDVNDYQQLVVWMNDKDPASAKNLPESKFNKEEEDRPFKHKGETYSKDTSYEKLEDLVKRVREDKKERLPIDAYQKLRTWMEPADRARWSGYLDGHLNDVARKFDMEQKVATEHGTRFVEPAQSELLSNPVIGVFLKVASVANQLVKMMPAGDVQDYLSSAHKELEEARSDRHKLAVEPGRTNEQKHNDDLVMDHIDEQLDKLEESHEEDRKNKVRKTKDIEIDASRDDPFVFDPWGLQ